jgi:hypothetical protein
MRCTVYGRLGFQLHMTRLYVNPIVTKYSEMHSVNLSFSLNYHL